MSNIASSTEGYPALASLQGQYPELAIYRRFSTLNARHILYLQAEIVNLEKDLENDSRIDGISDDKNTRLRNKNLYFLNKKNENGVIGLQWHTMVSVKEKLKEYSKYLADPKWFW